MANQHTIKKPAGAKVSNAAFHEKLDTVRPFIPEPATILHIPYADNDSEFISEVSGLISKWNGRPGTEPQAFAAAYKKLLSNYLSPDKNQDQE